MPPHNLGLDGERSIYSEQLSLPGSRLSPVERTQAQSVERAANWGQLVGAGGLFALPFPGWWNGQGGYDSPASLSTAVRHSEPNEITNTILISWVEWWRLPHPFDWCCILLRQPIAIARGDVPRFPITVAQQVHPGKV